MNHALDKLQAIMRIVKSRIVLITLTVCWMALSLAAFFVVQKPSFLQVGPGLLTLARTLALFALFFVTAASIGYYLLPALLPAPEPMQRLLYSVGLGMGVFGLVGFGLAVVGQARPLILLAICAVALIAAWRSRMLVVIAADLRACIADLRAPLEGAPRWIAGFAVISFGLTLLLALAPPVEAFDGLLYHLVVPSWWLRDHGIRLVNMPQYWFPSLMEGMFVWPLAFGEDSIPQLFHLSFGVASVLLTWDWAKRLWGRGVAWWTVALFLSMPSLPWLAAWAYTDLGLVFYSMTALLALSRYMATSNSRWLTLSGVMAGFAMGIKYTSFVLPVTMLCILLWRHRGSVRAFATASLRPMAECILVALPWYLRNWLSTGNPFYPFLFGGPYWDQFRAQWYAGSGTGIGWNIPALLTLPIVTTLGHRDVNFYDGRIGPLLLLLTPFTLWALWMARRERADRRQALGVLTAFAVANFLLWTYGAITTQHLWQSRLLLPGLAALVIPTSIGIRHLQGLDLPRLRLSFVFSALAGLTLLAFLTDFGLFVLRRNPMAVVLGMESRQDYSARLQPAYSAALTLINSGPPSAHIYLLNEPRSYGMDRLVQPDPINDNLAHDLYLYHDIPGVIRAWRTKGYTHVLLARESMDRGLTERDNSNPALLAALMQLTTKLTWVSATPRGEYILYQIPAE